MKQAHPDRAPRVSIVLPAYNAQDCLARAVESALNQSFADFELIIADDGSTDETNRIAEALAMRDARVRVLSLNHRGAAMARNAALDEARGTYIAFLDADDWMERGILARLVALADQHALDLALCGFQIDTQCGGTTHIQRFSAPSAVYETQASFRQAARALFDIGLLSPVWNKLYRASYLRDRGIRFPDTFMDDFPFNLAALRDIGRVGIIDEAPYHCTRGERISETSAPRQGLFERRAEEYAWMKNLYAHWRINDAPTREFLARRFAERAVGCVCDTFAMPLSSVERYRAVKAILKNEPLREALALAKPKSTAMKILLWSMRTGCAPLVCAEGRVMASVKRHNPLRFAKMKSNR